MKIKCTYFKDTGKFYTEGEEEFDYDTLLKGLIYPREIGGRLKELCRLPGLQSGTWNGPFVVEPEDTYPELVLP